MLNSISLAMLIGLDKLSKPQQEQHKSPHHTTQWRPMKWLPDFRQVKEAWSSKALKVKRTNNNRIMTWIWYLICSKRDSTGPGKKRTSAWPQQPDRYTAPWPQGRGTYMDHVFCSEARHSYSYGPYANWQPKPNTDTWPIQMQNQWNASSFWQSRCFCSRSQGKKTSLQVWVTLQTITMKPTQNDEICHVYMRQWAPSVNTSFAGNNEFAPVIRILAGRTLAFSQSI